MKWHWIIIRMILMLKSDQLISPEYPEVDSDLNDNGSVSYQIISMLFLLKLHVTPHSFEKEVDNSNLNDNVFLRISPEYP